MKRNRLTLFFCVAILLGVISRCFQLFCMTEANTGFILKQYTAFSTAVTVFIFVLILSVCLAASLIKIKSLKTDFSYPLSVVSAVAAVGIILEPLTLNYYNVLPVSVKIVSVILSVFSAAGLILFAISKTGKFKFNNTLLCATVVCQFMRLILAFMSTSKIVTVNDNIYELGFLCAALMFFVYFSQAHSNCGNEKTPLKMLILGVCAASFAMVSAVPKIIALIVGKGDLFYNGTSSPFADIALGLFILVAALEVEE